MRILVIGSGAREHALLWTLRRSERVTALYAAPGNGGTAALATSVAIPVDDHEALARFAAAGKIDLTVVGPEAPLVAGLADGFHERGLSVFGPAADGARIEGSKAWAKQFFERHGIPSAPFRVFDSAGEARDHVASRRAPMVVKADGLAAGKGVVVASTRAEALDAVDAMLVRREFGRAGESIVIEDCLDGEELSIHAITDGERTVLLPPAQDHKRLLDGDRGPNTGGMGAYAPAPLATPALIETIQASIIAPALRGFLAEGIRYRGVLYFGLMITAQGPQVLEVNCRFGDPETQVILPLLQGDLAALLAAASSSSLVGIPHATRPGAALCVVLASEGYPGPHRSGVPVTGLDRAAALDGVTVFHAGTRRVSRDQVLTSGGRVLGVTAVADDLARAATRAYQAASLISFPGMIYRRDIGTRAMGVTRSA